tara:strand:+ start:757 stop:1632 length:876 start_codon:yes stop_codon:yes gene_type:complete
MVAWLAPVIGGAIGLYGANKSSNAAKDAARLQNQATEAQYEYDKQAWEMQKQAAIADRDFAVQEIQMRAQQEGQLAAYKDASNLQNYNYNLQIRNMEQDTNEKMFQKSEAIYAGQVGINAQEARAAREDEKRKLEEIRTESLYEKNDEYLNMLSAEGEIRARGVTGRSAEKARSVKLLETSQKLALLDLSLANATRESNSTLRAIGRESTVADLNAYAARMLDPGVLPMPITPLATPQAQYMYPRVFQDYDFGPEPIRGAMASPAAASNRVWGTAITSLASTATDLIKAFQ